MFIYIINDFIDLIELPWKCLMHDSSNLYDYSLLKFLSSVISLTYFFKLGSTAFLNYLFMIILALDLILGHI